MKPTTGSASHRTKILDQRSKVDERSSAKSVGSSSTFGSSRQLKSKRTLIHELFTRLTELALRELGSKYAKYPELDKLPRCNKEAILDEIPLDVPLQLAIETIPDGRFWERLAKSRWSNRNFPR